MTITRYDIASNNCISFEPVGLTEGVSFSPLPLPLPYKFFCSSCNDPFLQTSFLFLNDLLLVSSFYFLTKETIKMNDSHKIVLVMFYVL